MNLETARFLQKKELLLEELAKKNIVPVKATPWAEYPFELRRNDKRAKGQPGQRFIGASMLPVVMEVLGVQDEKSCKAIREQIKSLRNKRGYM